MANIERYMYAENAQFKESKYKGCGIAYAEGYASVVEYYKKKHAESLEIFLGFKYGRLTKKVQNTRWD